MRSLLRLGSPQLISEAIRKLDEGARRYLLRDFRQWASNQQNPPKGEWDTWLFMGGRGAGKTRAGSEFVASMVAQGYARSIGVIGSTLDDARSVMVEGPAGLLQVRMRSRRPRLVRSRRKLVWPNGAEAVWFSADKPDQLRGPEFDLVWADEFAKWAEPQNALDNARFALRQGHKPRMMVTTTPKSIPALKALKAEGGVAVTQAATMANAGHLSAHFIKAVLSRYDGTALGRQEIYGELLESAEGELFRRAWFDAARVSAAPAMKRVVVAVDPAVTAKRHSSACGIVVAGKTGDGEAYVLGDYTVQGMTPLEWAACVARAAAAHGATLVVAETNQGGDMVTSALKTACPDLRIKGVTARHSKRTRAEAFIVPYQRGHVHHVGALNELEDEMCSFGADDAPSPDRMDALVWALSEVMPQKEPALPRAWTPGF